jgi:hypothetical protein
MPAKDFLVATLGQDGYEALSKAAQRLPALQSVFVPRTVIAWLDCARRAGFEGAIPGTQASLIKGELVVDGHAYDMAEPTRASAALIVSLMDDVRIPEELEPRLVARLAKSVDTLTKARFISMVKALEDAAAREQEITPGEATGSPETTESADDVQDYAEDLVKDAGWKSSDGLTIPRAGTPERTAWDQRYLQALADRYTGGDTSKLRQVKVPMDQAKPGHYVGDKPGLYPRYRVPMYRKMLAAGDQLPPVFVERQGPSKNIFSIIDGNARHKAATLHGKTKELIGYERIGEEKPVKGKKLDKGIEEPGKAAAPRAPLAPDAPDLASKAALTGMGQAKPAPVVSRARGFYKSELVCACPGCGQTQMRGRQVVGCLCIADVVAGAELVQKSEGDRIVLSGPDAVIAAIEDRLGLKPA